MADDGFNGTTISFATPDQTPLRDISVSESAAEVNVTGGADSIMTYESGIPDETVTYTIVGTSTVAIGAEGATVVAWNDGGSDGSLTNAVVVGKEVSGSMDGEILTAITVRPTAA